MENRVAVSVVFCERRPSLPLKLNPRVNRTGTQFGLLLASLELPGTGAS